MIKMLRCRALLKMFLENATKVSLLSNKDRKSMLFFGFSIDGIKVAEIRSFGDFLNCDLLFPLIFFVSLSSLFWAVFKFLKLIYT